MANTQLLFEKGIPAGIKRLVNPDVIQILVVEHSNKLLNKWSGSLAKEADKIINGNNRGFFGLFKKRNPLVESGAIRWALYGNKGYGLSQEDWQYLRLLKSVRALRVFTEPRASLDQVDESQIRMALESLVEDTKSDIFPVMIRDYAAVARAVSPKIERHCLEVYEEECQSGEGEEIFNGDLKLSVKLGVIRTSPPEGLEVWRSFLPMILS